jgi:hypothetical protein
MQAPFMRSITSGVARAERAAARRRERIVGEWETGLAAAATARITFSARAPRA